MAATTARRVRVRAPKLALLPASTPPGAGLLLSALLHAAAVSALLTWQAIVFPERPAIVAYSAADMRREPDYHVLMFAGLPRIEDASPPDDREQRPGTMTHSAAAAAPGDSRPPSHPPTPDFAGPQEIVSNFPDATNNVQTILQPDLVAPPKLVNPVRLQSLVTLPAPATPVPAAPQLEPRELPRPQELPTLPASQSLVQIPVSLIGSPERSSVAPTEPVAPTIAGTDAKANATRAIVVIDAVSVPPEPVSVIPDAELLAHFVVAPSTDGVEAGGGSAAVAPSGSPSGAGAQPGSAPGAGAAAGSEGPVGIAILGGTPGRSGRAVATSSIPRSSYGLTIVSGGSSGGAARDLGVFSRSDTVYTVWIPMTDEGGGPDWSIEYALMNPAPAGNGLLTPPVALKKVRATGSRTDPSANSRLVFVTGVIDETGKLQAVRAIRTSDVGTQSAVNALAQWEFLPATLDGKPVVSKVLIGVGVIPAEEVGKRNR